MTEESERPTFGDFLDKHYRQFAVMGIFGTVSVFLGENFPGGSETLSARAAIFATLIIFSLTAAWICFTAIDELLNGINDQSRSIFTELGYAVIVLTTATLAISIGRATTNYNEVLQLARPVAVVASGIILYARIYPSDRYDIQSSSPGEVAFMSLFTTMLFIGMISEGVGLMMDGLTNIFNNNVLVRESLGFLYLALFHLAVSESIAGLHELGDAVKNRDWVEILIDILEFIMDRSSWSYSVSVTIGFGMLLVILFALDSASANVNSAGYFSVYGYFWKEFLAMVYFGYNTIVVIGLLSTQKRLVDEVDMERYSQYFQVLLLGISIIFLFALHTGYIGEAVVKI